MVHGVLALQHGAWSARIAAWCMECSHCGMVHGVLALQHGAWSARIAAWLHTHMPHPQAAWPARPCLGFRKVKEGHAGPFEWMSYSEVSQAAASISSAFAQLGLQSKDALGIIGVNCPEWMIAMQVGWQGAAAAYMSCWSALSELSQHPAGRQPD